jgi:hypothetical protein
MCIMCQMDVALMSFSKDPSKFARCHLLLLLVITFLAKPSMLTITPTMCDFSLSTLHVTSSLSKSVYYPPLPVVSAQSRHSWTCQLPNESSDIPFIVLLSATMPVSGMLALAFDEHVSLRTEVIMTDFPSDGTEGEWQVEALAVLSNSFESALTLPILQVKFGSKYCGCVSRLRFTWDKREGADNGSCEAHVSMQSGRLGNACFPSWAFETPSALETGFANESIKPHILVDLHSSHPCHPLPSDPLPIYHAALRTASFNGHCK